MNWLIESPVCLELRPELCGIRHEVDGVTGGELQQRREEEQGADQGRYEAPKSYAESDQQRYGVPALRGYLVSQSCAQVKK